MERFLCFMIGPLEGSFDMNSEDGIKIANKKKMGGRRDILRK